MKSCSNLDIYCLYPHQRVSDVQELQMITILDKNVHVYRTEGNSDEQASVLKEIFMDEDFANEFNLCSINSINWARICVQASYYFWSYLQVFQSSQAVGILLCLFSLRLVSLLTQYLSRFIDKLLYSEWSIW